MPILVRVCHAIDASVGHGVGFGRSLSVGAPFIALRDGLLQRTSSILQLFRNEPLLLAYLSVM